MFNADRTLKSRVLSQLLWICRTCGELPVLGFLCFCTSFLITITHKWDNCPYSFVTPDCWFLLACRKVWMGFSGHFEIRKVTPTGGPMFQDVDLSLFLLAAQFNYMKSIKCFTLSCSNQICSIHSNPVQTNARNVPVASSFKASLCCDHIVWFHFHWLPGFSGLS